MSRMVIISDLHIGEGVRSQDLNPYPSGGKVIPAEQFIEKFCAFISKESITADYLLVPGDLTNKAEPVEFEHAADIISKIAVALHVPVQNVVVVPGNHDLDWSVHKPGSPDPTGFRKKQMLAPLADSSEYIKSIFSRASKSLLAPPHFAIWEDDNIFLVGYNSACNDDPNVKPHFGIVRKEDIQELDEALAASKSHKNKIKIFMVHHHPLSYPNPLPDSADFSQMVNAESVLELLNKHAFDFLIHGHKHFPRFTTRASDAQHPLVILGASSFTRELPFSYHGFASNQFHLIEIHGRQAATQAISGVLKTWTFLSHHGWSPSQERDGIECHRPFGTYTSINEMRQHVLLEVTNILQTKEYVSWKQLCSIHPDWDYYPSPTVIHIFKQIAQENGLKQIAPSSSDDIYLFKE